MTFRSIELILDDERPRNWMRCGLEFEFVADYART